jgi:hypothetical protein
LKDLVLIEIFHDLSGASPLRGNGKLSYSSLIDSKERLNRFLNNFLNQRARSLKWVMALGII